MECSLPSKANEMVSAASPKVRYCRRASSEHAVRLSFRDLVTAQWNYALLEEVTAEFIAPVIGDKPA